MKESWKEEKKEMKAQVDEMKSGLKEQEAELKAREEKMGHSLDYLMKSSNETIKMTREETINQIGSISNMATIEARNTIERIFRERNFDAFVEEIAEERMKPQIGNIIDNYEQIKINKAIDDLNNPDRIIVTKSLIYLQLNQDKNLTEEQVARMLKTIDNASDENIKQGIMQTLIYRKSNNAYEYFKRDLLEKDIIQSSDFISTAAIMIVISSDTKNDINFYTAVIKKASDKAWLFSYLIDNASAINKNLAIKFLNSKEMVDMAFDSENIQNYKSGFESNSYLKNQNLSETYFFKKASK